MGFNQLKTRIPYNVAMLTQNICVLNCQSKFPVTLFHTSVMPCYLWLEDNVCIVNKKIWEGGVEA